MRPRKTHLVQKPESRSGQPRKSQKQGLKWLLLPSTPTPTPHATPAMGIQTYSIQPLDTEVSSSY